MNNTELLQECKLQLEYLNLKFPATGTTNSLLAKIETTLQNQMDNVTEPEIKNLEDILLCLGKAHNMLAKTSLSKEEYQPISGLLAKAKVELFNFCNDRKSALQNKVSDISAEKWKVFSHTSALGNTGDYMSDCGIENGTISFYCDKPDDITNEELQEICDSLNSSIVNERKDNIGVNLIKWIRENWIVGANDLWRRQKDMRDQRTDQNLYEEYLFSEEEESEKELEERTEMNMNVISDFCEHVKNEVGLVIPESTILSFFNA